jgi:hypothetical protein
MNLPKFILFLPVYEQWCMKDMLNEELGKEKLLVSGLCQTTRGNRNTVMCNLPFWKHSAGTGSGQGTYDDFICLWKCW